MFYICCYKHVKIMEKETMKIYQKIKKELMGIIIEKYPEQIRHTEVVKEETFDFLIYEIAKLKKELNEMRESK